MLNLYLLRHGKASGDAGSDGDFDRKLNKKGTAQSNQIGFILKQNGIKFDQIIASGALRTVQTAEIIKHFTAGPDIQFFDDLYLARMHKIVECLNSEGKGTDLLYVGHNFGISDICGYLTGDNLSLSTAQLVHIRFNFDVWKMVGQETGEFVETIVPDVYIF
jgi:phosphohistidine phosphatase